MIRYSVAVIAAGLVLAASAQEVTLSEGWDFVPSEKLLLFDDFTDMPKGAAPPHWAVRKAAAKLTAAGRLLLPASSQLWPNVKTWPNNFTIEQDLSLEKPAENGERQVWWSFGSRDEEWVWRISAQCEDDAGVCRFSLETVDENLGRARGSTPSGSPTGSRCGCRTGGFGPTLTATA